MRKFLLLTYHFPPSQAVAVHRMLGLARHLPEFGWQPIVVAPPGVPGDPQDPELLKLIPPDTTVRRVSFPQGWWGKIARRFFPYGCWLPAAKRACRALVREHRPEAVITSSPPVAIAFLGEYLKNKFGLPWIADYRDPSYAINPYRKVPISKHHWEARLEMRTMKLADQITANTPIMLEGMQAAYPQHAHKITLITNGFDRTIVPLTPLPPRANRQLTIVHAGELYVGRDPRPIFDALQQLCQERPDQPWRLRLLGQSYCGDLAEAIRQRGLEEVVSVEGQVEFARALKSIQDAHVLMLLHTPGFRMTIPAKLYEYIAAGRPILALAEPDGDVAWVLKTAGACYRIAQPSTSTSAEEVKRQTERIKQALTELRGEIEGQPAPVLSSDKAERFSRHHMAELMAQCLDRCVPAAGRPSRSARVQQPC